MLKSNIDHGYVIMTREDFFPYFLLKCLLEDMRDMEIWLTVPLYVIWHFREKKIISVHQINLFITKYWVVQLAVVMLFGFLMLFAYLYFWQYTFVIVHCTQSVIHLLGNRLFSYVTRRQKNRPGWHELKVLHHRKVMNTRWFSLVMRRVFPESSNSLSVSCSSKSPGDRIAQNTLELKQEDSTIPFGPCL